MKNKHPYKNCARRFSLSSITSISSILGIATISGIVASFGGVGVYATGVADEINVNIPVACSLTNIVDSAHTASIENSTYVDDIGETTFKVFCNDAEGFAVYAVGNTNDEPGNNKLEPTNLASSYAIVTGTATSGNTSNWAMKLTAVTGTYAPTLGAGFNDYHIIPNSYTKVASYASNTDATTGSSFKSTYAVYASPTQPADSYTGKVKYTIVHPASEAAPVEIGQLTYMQDFNNLTPTQRATVLNSMEYDTTYSLIDSRDNKTYQIARLKDDNIWMAENLDLGRTALTAHLTSANTNLDTNVATIISSTFNSWKRTSGSQSYTSAEYISVTGTDSTSGTPYGTLYNYCAASAGTICSAEGANDRNATSDICPAGWRLPTGRDFGEFGEFQALYSLTEYNTYAKMRAPITDGGAAFALAGHFVNSVPNYQESSGEYARGEYWTSAMNSGRTVTHLFLDTSNVSAQSGSARDQGYSIRCIAKRPSRTLTISYSSDVSTVQVDGVAIQNGGTVNVEEGSLYRITMVPNDGYRFSSWSIVSGSIDSANTQTITYTAESSNPTLTAHASPVTAVIMQNLSSSDCTTTASYAKDNRDGHVYVIQRLADGKCWMMENLDLGRTELTTDLTSSNTNLTNTVTASTFNSWKKVSTSQSYTTGEFIPVDGTDPTSNTQYGTLYNYCVASASTICSASGSNNDDAISDICPAGWRLPTGNTTGEFQALYSLTEYNTYAKMRAPITDGGAAFALAGNSNVSIPVNHGKQGHYWSSTRGNGSQMYVLQLYKTNLFTNRTDNRHNGFSVRCVSDI